MHHWSCSSVGALNCRYDRRMMPEGSRKTKFERWLADEMSLKTNIDSNDAIWNVKVPLRGQS